MRRLALACLLLCTALAAHADDASKLAKVEEYFKLAKLDRLAAQTMSMAASQINSSIMGNMMGVTFTADQKKQIDAVQAQVMQLLQKSLGWDALEPEYAKIYAAAYTEEELDGLLAFYRSPAGQAMVAKTPALMSQANTIVQAHMSTVMPQLQQILKESAPSEASKPGPK